MLPQTGLLAKGLPRLLSGYPAAGAVLLAHFLIAVGSVREKSNTYDEIAHITGGLSYWRENDYRLHPENGNLSQRWLALPLLTLPLKFPKDPAMWSASDVWNVGYQFFFSAGNDPEKLLWRARCINAMLSAGLGLLVYAWSRKLFGPGGGMLSLLVYAANPTILANGSLATSDMAAAAFFTVTVGCLWKLFHKLSPAGFLGSWLALSGLFLSKMSAWLIVAMGAALLVVRLMGDRPLSIAWRESFLIHRRIAQAGVLLGVMLVQAALVVATIWACYGFRYSAFHEPRTGEEHLYCAWSQLLADTGVLGRAVEFARENRLLPEAYLYGTLFVGHHAQERPAFLNGQYSVTGWRCFFPYAFLVKMPLPAFAFLILACAGAVWSWRQARSRQGCAVRRCAWRAFYATAPLWILLTVYWAAAIPSKLNIGQRHILPTYAAMFILAGATAHWFGRRSRLPVCMAVAVLACALALAGQCCATYPHYLAYFNWIAGGSRNGYKHLVDSSLDWGQDLPGLKRWLTEHDLGGPGQTPAFLAYFGTSSPSYYQVPAMELGGGRVTPLAGLTAGVYCISATSLQRIYQPAPGQWCASYENVYRQLCEIARTLETADPATRSQLPQSKGEAFWREMLPLYDDLRLGRLCALLRQREPDANVGYSILIYRLSAEDVRKALFGPPIMEVIEPDNQALRLNPDHPAPHIILGIALARLGKTDEAVKHYQQALRLNPKSPEAHNDLGVTLADLGKTREAIEHYQQALLAEPDYVDARYNLGLSLTSMRRLSEAMDQYNQVLRLKPDYAAAHRNLALLMAATGRTDEAIEHFRHVVRLEPDEAAAHGNLGNALAAVGKTDQAIQQFREALLLKPDAAEVHNNLGFILAGMGRSGEAIEHYRQALRLQPEYVKAHNNLANVLASVGKIDEAIARYNEALRLMPDSRAALNSLAWLLATREGAQNVAPARAVELAERARELSGQDNAQCLDTLAAAYAAAGRFSDAVLAAKRAVQLAESAGQTALVKKIRARLELYRAARPYREAAQAPAPIKP